MLHLFVVFKVSSLTKKGLSATCRVIFKLLLNEEKTKFLLIGTKQQLAKVDIGHIKVDKVNIAPHSPVKNLGVWFDSNLSMVNHITKTCSVAFYYLYNIRRIRKYLTKKCTETLIHAFISTGLDYCNSLLSGVPDCHLHKLKRVQNAAARLIFQESRFCHITLLLWSLHWLPVKYRIVIKIILITFKAVHGLAPAYKSDWFLLETPEDMIYVPMTAYSLLLAGVKHSPRSAIDLSMRPPLNCGTIFQALSETPNL